MPKLKLALAAAVVLAGLAGCGRNPQFRLALANEAYASLNALYVLLAEAELGALSTPASFAGRVESYATVIGGLEASRLLAAVPLPDAATPEADALDRCLAEIRQMSELHRATGIAPGAAITRSVRLRCDTAIRAIAAEAATTWIFTTAVDEL